jgi:23S rRNA (adenine2503-C2)-methyltransferase
MLSLLAQSSAELETWFRDQGLPAYRARQVRKWIFDRRAGNFDEMTDLPLALRSRLAEEISIWSGRIAAHAVGEDGSEKLLFEQFDGNRVECVLLRDDRHHRTVCLSSQIGCAMKCAFCATGIDGVVRNLAAEEIIEHLLHIQRLLPAEERLSNIVVMGMGEPLLNLDGILPALAVATSPEGLGIGVRRVTISTVGLPKGIRQLADLDCPYHLALSLHAPNDEIRDRIVPANRGVGIAALLKAADYYFEKTGRRVTFEYVLLADINDQPEHALQLVELLRGRPSLVNLIPYNPIPELPFRTPDSSVTAKFAEILTQHGLTTVIRYRKGDRISAACGQLRRIHS